MSPCISLDSLNVSLHIFGFSCVLSVDWAWSAEANVKKHVGGSHFALLHAFDSVRTLHMAGPETCYRPSLLTMLNLHATQEGRHEDPKRNSKKEKRGSYMYHKNVCMEIHHQTTERNSKRKTCQSEAM